METKFKNCYVKVTLKTLFTEAFDKQGRLRIAGTISKEAVLHERQVNDPAKFEQIKNLMWEELKAEQGWGNYFHAPLNRLYSCTTVRIPKKSAPITYKI